MVARVIKYGNDIFKDILNKSSGRIYKASYWDLWIAIIAEDKFDNNIKNMIDYLSSGKSTYNKWYVEGVVNHVNLLNKSLLENDLLLSDILINADDDFIKKQKIKATVKIIEMRFKDKEKSIWMINTPRKKRKKQAMRGYWKDFSANPKMHSYAIERCYKSSGFYTKNQSFTLEKKLRNCLKREKKEVDGIDELFALYRAALTIMLERMERVDDSYGVIGQLYGEIFEKYIQLDRTELEMEVETFFLDLIELITWEDYGCTDSYQLDFIKSISSKEVELVKMILSNQIKELNNLKFYYFEKKCKVFLSKLCKSHPC
jgi:hypothetical protein